MNTQNRTDNTILPCSQRNPQWAAERVGHSARTIGTHGSLLTCMAMLAGTTPDAMNALRMEHDDGAAEWHFDVSREADQASGRGVQILRFSGLFRSMPFPESEEEQLLAHLAAKQPAIIRLDTTPEGRPDTEHFVIGAGATDRQIHIIDPWDGAACTLLPRYGCRNNRTIAQAVLYETSSALVEVRDSNLIARAGRNRFQQE